MSTNAKSTKKSPSESTSDSLPLTAGSLASKITQIPVSLLKKGDMVLYPGNKVIPVESVTCYSAPGQSAFTDLYVVKFENQPSECYLAFEIGAKIYIYLG